MKKVYTNTGIHNAIASLAKSGLSHLMGAAIIGSCLLVAGCESSSDSDDDSGETLSETSVDSNSSHPMFPDGLHPNGAGSDRIARVFASALGALDPGDERPIVCIGDSITASGYPAILEEITGRTVINAGAGGERSTEGVARVGGVLSKHKPSHLCILYGINDINSGHPNSEVIGSLNAIVAAARAAGAEPIVGTLTPVFGKYAENQVYVNDLNSRIRSLGVRIANLAGAF